MKMNNKFDVMMKELLLDKEDLSKIEYFNIGKSVTIGGDGPLFNLEGPDKLTISNNSVEVIKRVTLTKSQANKFLGDGKSLEELLGTINRFMRSDQKCYSTTFKNPDGSFCRLTNDGGIELRCFGYKLKD